MKNVRTFADLSATLTKRAAAIKSGSQNGSQKKAGEESGQTPPVPERDPRAEGTVSIPVDPDAAPGKAVGLERPTNAEVTSSFTIPPDKTVVGEEKPAKAADLAKKAQSIAAGIRDLSAQLAKKAEVGADGKSVTPNMPANTQVNEGTTQGGKNQPPSGGAGAKNNPDPNAKTAGSSMNAEGTDTEKKVSLPAGDTKGNIPDSKTNTDASKGEGQAAVQSKGGDKMASKDDFVIDSSYHLKLASLILSTEEGRSFAQRQIEKAHGAEAAADLIKAAAIMEDRAVEMAQLESQGAFEAEEMWKNASEEDRNKIVKLARVHATARDQYPSELEKMAYDAGAMMGAQMGDAGMLGGAGAGVGPEAGAEGAPAGLPPGAGAEAGGMGVDGGAGGAGGELSPDAVVAALDQMVSSGELQPEMAAEILQAIMGGGAGGEGGAPGGAGGAPGGAAGGMPPEMAAAAGGGGMPPGAAGGGGPPEGGKGGSEKKEESKKEESEEEKEARLIKKAHEIAIAAMKPATAKAA